MSALPQSRGLLVLLVAAFAACDDPIPTQPELEPVDRGRIALVVGVPDALRAGEPVDVAIWLTNHGDDVESDVRIFWCVAAWKPDQLCTPQPLAMSSIGPGETLSTTLAVSASVALAGDTAQLRIFQRGLGDVAESEPFPENAVLLPVHPQ